MTIIELSIIILFLLALVIQPIVLGLYANKSERFKSIMWGFLALALSIAIIAFFDTHVGARSTGDMAAEVGIAIIISTIIILIILVARRAASPETTEGDFQSRLRRGLFRIWVLITVPWIMIFVIEYTPKCARYNCEMVQNLLAMKVDNLPVYIGIGEWVIAIPTLAFGIGLGACWVIDGFKRG